MADLAGKLDLSRYVPVNYPGVVSYKNARGCPMPKRRRQCPRVPCYTKDFFCAEWGQNFKCMCPPPRRTFISPYTGVKDELASLDYFTKLPDNPNRKFPTPQYPASMNHRTMAERYALDEIYDCPRGSPGWSRLCPENQKMFTIMHQDTICGNCLPSNKANPQQYEPPIDCNDQDQTSPEDMYDLPFRVQVGAFPQDTEEMKRPKLPRTGVGRCLQPSSIHDVQSVHRDAFRDFYKMKTLNELKYYRSPLAIDPRRPPLVIPSDNENDLVVSGPLCVNAVPLFMRPKGGQKFPRNLGPNFQVIVQGPICI